MKTNSIYYKNNIIYTICYIINMILYYILK